MSADLLYALLIYGGFALFFALAGVVVQAVFVAFAAHLGSRLLASVPFICLGGGAIGVALSQRNLRLDELHGGLSLGGGGSQWVTRGANLLLLAIALAKITQMLFAQRARSKLLAPTPKQRANRRLFVAFLVYVFCSLVLPMVFGTRPAFSHDGLVAVPMFTAAYLARGERLDAFLTVGKWTLMAMVFASLCLAALAPQLVASKYMSGWIPGLNVRLWGLSSHPNQMGALAIFLMILLGLRPAHKKWLNATMWMLTLAALFLTQSKTSWLAGMVALGAIWIYRHGRDVHGHLRLEVVITTLLGMALLAACILFIDVDSVLAHFLDSEVGSGLTTFTGRTKVWSVAVDMWLESPWFGYGTEAWSPLHRIQLGVPFATQAHNQLLEALSVGGLAYAIPMIVYFVLIGAGAFRCAQRTGGVSIAIFLVIAVRCISEAPFGIGNMTDSDVVLQLLLFMMVINEAPGSQSFHLSKPTAEPLAQRSAHLSAGRGPLHV